MLTSLSLLDALTEASNALEEKFNHSFNNIYSSFMDTMDGSGAQDDAFVNTLTDAMDMLALPLHDEAVEATFTTDDGNVKAAKIIEIGERMDVFKNSIAKDRDHLCTYWNEWEAIQDEFIRLGVSVFGSESFASREDAAAVADLMGANFLRDMLTVNHEYSALFNDMAEQIADIGAGLVEEVEAAEHVGYQCARSGMAITLLTLS